MLPRGGCLNFTPVGVGCDFSTAALMLLRKELRHDGGAGEEAGGGAGEEGKSS
jgi:hypothetical protein